MTKLMRSNPSHIDYGDFKGLIPKNPNFVPSNIDGIVERNGKFLVMEWKRPNEKVSIGQQILLKALSSKPGFTCVVINGNTDTTTEVNKFYKVTPKGCVYLGQGFDAFKEYYLEWYD